MDKKIDYTRYFGDSTISEIFVTEDNQVFYPSGISYLKLHCAKTGVKYKILTKAEAFKLAEKAKKLEAEKLREAEKLEAEKLEAEKLEAEKLREAKKGVPEIKKGSIKMPNGKK